jgi:glycosyl transferase family 25
MNNINKIYYINLEHRVDRKLNIEGELTKFGLNFERFNAVLNLKDGMVGCNQSHINVLKLAKQNNFKNVLILEDDFTFLVSKSELEKQVHTFFELKMDYDVLMFSYNLQQCNTFNNTIGKVIEAQTASGYLVNSTYYDILIDHWEINNILQEQTGEHWNYSDDQSWKQLQKRDNWYYFNTRIGKQMEGFSDLGKEYRNYNC